MAKMHDGSTSTGVLAVIAQAGLVTRRMLSAMLYRQNDEGEVERYSSHPITLTRTMKRLTDKGYIDIKTVKENNKDYCCLTEEGWKAVMTSIYRTAHS